MKCSKVYGVLFMLQLSAWQTKAMLLKEPRWQEIGLDNLLAEAAKQSRVCFEAGSAYQVGSVWP